MNRTELMNLKKILKQETDRRNRVNELLKNKLIQEFISLNNLNINELQSNDKWPILEEILKEFKITESNEILVCIGCYLVACDICYQETNYYTEEVLFDNPYIEYQKFKDIETNMVHTAYFDKYIQRRLEDEKIYYFNTEMTASEFCHTRYGKYLVSELKEKYTVLNPYNSSKNSNGFNEVKKDYFITAIEKGQPKAKQLVLNKYSKYYGGEKK